MDTIHPQFHSRVPTIKGLIPISSYTAEITNTMSIPHQDNIDYFHWLIMSLYKEATIEKTRLTGPSDWEAGNRT